MARVALLTFYEYSAVGIRTIGPYLKQNGHECLLLFLKDMDQKRITTPQKDVVNYQTVSNGALCIAGYDISPVSHEEIEEALDVLVDFKPDVVGISTRSMFDDLAEDIAGRIRQKLPETLLVGGGFGPTLSFEKWSRFVDVVVRGDGEEVMLDITNAVEAGLPVEDISNTVYVKSGEMVTHPLRAPEVNLSKYPVPFFFDEHSVYIDHNVDSFQADSFRHNKIYPILMGRGCVGKCAYCSGGNWRTIYKDSGLSLPPRRMREVKDIKEELLKAKNKGYKRVTILDEFLVGPYTKMVEVFRFYADEIRLPFICRPHPHMLKTHPDFFSLLLEGGMDQTIVGVQSGDEHFADDIYNRKQNNKSIVEFAKKFTDHGVSVAYHFIGGNPLETEESFRNTLDLIKQLPFSPGLDSINTYFLRPFPRSPIVERFGVESLSGYDLDNWYREALLMFLRAICKDDEFAAFEHIRNPYEMNDAMLDLVAEKVLKGEKSPLASSFREDLQKCILKKMQGSCVYIWGTGSRYREIKQKMGKMTISAFFDNSTDRHGEYVDGVEILAPAKLHDMPRLPVIIASTYYAEIQRQIREIDQDILTLPM